MKQLGVILSLAAAFAALTWVGGWVGVALLGAGAGLLLRSFAATQIGAAASFAWLALVASADRDGSLGRLTTRLGGIFGIPGWGIVLAAALFAFAIAWSSARLAAGLRAR